MSSGTEVGNPQERPQMENGLLALQSNALVQAWPGLGHCLLWLLAMLTLTAAREEHGEVAGI